MTAKREPKPPRKIWIVRVFDTQLWSSPILCSEQAAINFLERERKRGRDGYIIGPYLALVRRSVPIRSVSQEGEKP